MRFTIRSLLILAAICAALVAFWTQHLSPRLRVSTYSDFPPGSGYSENGPRPKPYILIQYRPTQRTRIVYSTMPGEPTFRWMTWDDTMNSWK